MWSRDEQDATFRLPIGAWTLRPTGGAVNSILGVQAYRSLGGDEGDPCPVSPRPA